MAIYRPSDGKWYIRGLDTLVFGTAGDIPVPGDYNGDGRVDLAVFRPANGTWYIRGISTIPFGMSGDIPVPADYNGDGKTEIAVFRPSNGKWYIRLADTIPFGMSGDIPVPADYNGDKKTEIAIYRPREGQWYIRGVGNIVFGIEGDVPIPADYSGDGRADLAVFRPADGKWYLRGVGTIPFGSRGDVPVPARYTTLSFPLAKQTPLNASTIAIAAELGYGLKADAAYQNLKLYHYGPTATINFGLPVYHSGTGAFLGLTFNYKYKGGNRWTFIKLHKNFDTPDKINLYLSFLNSHALPDGSNIHDWIQHKIAAGDAYQFSSSIIFLKKDKGQIILDGNGTRAMENGFLYSSSISSTTSRIKAIDCWGNNITALEKTVHYNGVRHHYADVALCFVKGTLVHTKHGLKPIEIIQHHDEVLAWCEETKKTGYKKVLKTVRSTTDKLVTVTVGQQVIHTTERHPFLTASGEWMAAAKLEAGALLRTAGGKNEKVTSVKFTSTPLIPVYNLEIEDWQTYAVGSSGIIVHNECVINNWAANQNTITVEFYQPIGGSITLSCVPNHPNMLYVTEIKMGVGTSFKANPGGLAIDLKGDAGLRVTSNRDGSLNWEGQGRLQADFGNLLNMGMQIRQNLLDLNRSYVGARVLSLGVGTHVVWKDGSDPTFTRINELKIGDCRWDYNRGWANCKINPTKLFGR